MDVLYQLSYNGEKFRIVRVFCEPDEKGSSFTFSLQRSKRWSVLSQFETGVW